MVNSNFILASVAAAFISTLLLKIFRPEIDGLVQNIRDNKPNSIMENPVA